MWRPYLERKAQELYGARWYVAATKPKPGRRRKAMRDGARQSLALREARLQGLSCETCASFQRQTPGFPGRAHCSRGSDFHGYELINRSGLCAGYREAPRQQGGPGHD